MEKREELIVYHRKDIDKIVGSIDSPECKEITTAWKLALIASILEAGKPLEEHIEEEKKEEDV